MNPHSKLASFYRYFYLTGDLPNNLCNYFWGLVIAFICFPFVWVAMFINWYNGKIIYNEKSYNEYEYNEKGGYVVTAIRSNNYYNYNREVNEIPTFLGLVFTILLIVVGLITIKIHFLMTGTYIAANSIPLAFIALYIGGVLTALVGLLIFKLIMTVSRIVTDMNKKVIKPLSFLKQKELDKKRLDEYRANTTYKLNNPNFLILSWRWLKATKEKNCPIITWDFENNKPKK